MFRQRKQPQCRPELSTFKQSNTALEDLNILQPHLCMLGAVCLLAVTSGGGFARSCHTDGDSSLDAKMCWVHPAVVLRLDTITNLPPPATVAGSSRAGVEEGTVICVVDRTMLPAPKQHTTQPIGAHLECSHLCALGQAVAAGYL